MGMYGRAAITAARMLEKGVPSDPERAWKRAISLETESSESRKKSCPRGALLELCAAGVILGCKKRQSLLRGSNGEYAVRLLEAIRRDQQLLSDQKSLWHSATQNAAIEENGQIDVVASLWRAGLIQ